MGVLPFFSGVWWRAVCVFCLGGFLGRCRGCVFNFVVGKRVRRSSVRRLSCRVGGFARGPDFWGGFVRAAGLAVFCVHRGGEVCWFRDYCGRTWAQGGSSLSTGAVPLTISGFVSRSQGGRTCVCFLLDAVGRIGLRRLSCWAHRLERHLN